MLNDMECRERERKSGSKKVIEREFHMIVIIMGYQVYCREKRNDEEGRKDGERRKGNVNFR